MDLFNSTVKGGVERARMKKYITMVGCNDERKRMFSGSWNMEHRT